MNNKVLIIGSGPVGLTTALSLVKSGIDVEIIEQNDVSTTYSKALSVSAATLKALHGLGVADALIVEGKKIFDIDIYYHHQRCAHINNRLINSNFNYYLCVPQPVTENVLEGALNKIGVYVKRGIRAYNINEKEHEVEVLFDSYNQTQHQRGSYGFVIGCDGARSTVRKSIGAQFTGHDYDIHFLMADFTLISPLEHLNSSYHIIEDRFMIFLPLSNDKVRIVIKEKGPLPEIKPNIDLSQVQHYLDKFYHKPITALKVEWTSSANFFNRLADKVMTNRQFIAGDAFHLFSPIGGQGMNTGIQDALSLAWRLAGYIKHKMPFSILEQYANERTYAVKKVLQRTHINTLAIAGMDRNHPDIKHYHASLSNRRERNIRLAMEFSGLDNDYRQSENDVAGRHVPYFVLSKTTCFTTYDIPTLKKFVLIISSSCAQDLTNVQWKILKDLNCHAFTLDDENFESLVSACSSKSINPLLIRPDAYIAAQNKFDELMNNLTQTTLYGEPDETISIA